jgi:hypothetical protein
MIFNCPNCEQELEADDAGVGMLVSCPTCTHELTIPASEPQPQQVQPVFPTPPPVQKKAASRKASLTAPAEKKNPILWWIIFLVILVGIIAISYLAAQATA